MAERDYTSRRLAIINALVDKLKAINGTGTYRTELNDNVVPRLKFWDEVEEFPAVHLNAGIVHLTKQLGAELGALGVRVNAVSPGPVETAMAQKVHTAEIRADYYDAIPLGRYGLEEELARAIYFLSSEESSYINGETLNVDGGFAATGIGLASFRDIPK